MANAPSIFLSVAEASADLYAAGLMRAFPRRCPGATFWGLTGPCSREAGAATFFDLTAHASMLTGVVGNIPRVLLMLRRLRRELAARRPAAAVLIDSPALNLSRIAPMCNRLGIPVLYYVAPQTWAWAEKRVEQMRRRIDRLLVILPFEEAYFARHGIRARFVGHPLFERLEATQPDAARVAAYRARGAPVLALLPGSRRQVIQEVLPGQLEVAASVRRTHAGAAFLVVAAHAAAEDLARGIVGRLGPRLGLPVERFAFDHRWRDEMLLAADLALVASGTATLEVAYRATPMIVMYNHGRWMYPLAKFVLGLLGRPFITTPWLSLPNILAGRELAPEFMPFYRSAAPIARAALSLLDDDSARERMSRDLAALVAPMVRTDVSEQAAEELAGLIGSRA